ncbi:UDP-arabinose 4-epimerase [Tistlia consotensis]|uniref:UDP-glucose 4-epimerase n=1 Tax=Tistlia consotensis USBA 355 TaxID=560819 RepID=A0A1Y6CKR1_9PROT|nr:UDP-glucose 4-epimerase GalE [Tistlia consotensis]SMF59135.1 UDP-arabinose 4-epimerase [Tistlia consotensis USBA 355]SNR64174.1 UDP-arabinose 4-epimerase [Tistlia consotensis]
MATPLLVTGGAGYIGSHVCKALAAAGWLPVTYDNLSNGHRWAVRWGPLEVGDLQDRARLDAVLERWRPQAVLHFAAYIAAGESVVDPGKYYENNVLGLLSLLAAMGRAGLDRIVFSSTAAVYGTPRRVPIDERHPLEPVNPYGSTKLVCEQLLRDFAVAHGIRSVALRYFNAAGADPDGELGEAHEPETHLIPLVLEAAAGLRPEIAIFGEDYPTADGTCIRDYIHVADLAQAHLLALDRLSGAEGTDAFNLGNGAGFSVRQVVEAARRVTGRPIAVRVRAARPGDPPVLVADAGRARSDLGWRPRHSALDEQLAHAWQWLTAPGRRPRADPCAIVRPAATQIANSS